MENLQVGLRFTRETDSHEILLSKRALIASVILR